MRGGGMQGGGEADEGGGREHGGEHAALISPVSAGGGPLLSPAHVSSVAQKRSRWLLAVLALTVANAIFGVGNVVSKVGLQGTNPVVFALIREAVAGPLLCAAAAIVSRRQGASAMPQSADAWRFLLCALGLFTTNLCYIIGVKLAGATTAGIWQPAQPVLICVAASALGYERLTAKKVVGIAIAVLGCLCVVAAPEVLHDGGSGSAAGSGSSSATVDRLAGNLLFAVQVSGAGGFYVAQKPLLPRYPPIVVLGWSYVIASLAMLCVALVFNDASHRLLDFVCDDCDGHGWRLPAGALGAVAYWIFMGSIAAYWLNTWGNQHVDVSLVGAFTVVQPVATIASSQVLIAASAEPHWGLDALRWSDSAAVIIVVGLGLVLCDSRARPDLASPGPWSVFSEAGDDIRSVVSVVF
eukprot:TRINITY_DN70139_c0_g1_i1.p2 TRINITY_DN70139_c0_g1~~TRINITY_DN70139_c0_g1_i1.p2  ORF type:complete len:411 (+),score=105.91 TRINITY_DN70139_c0_g1_i1:142-1374(+)